MVNATTPSLPSPVARTNPSLHVAHSAAYLPKEPHAQHLSQQLIHRTAAAAAQETSSVLRRQRIERPAHSPPRALTSAMKSASAPFKAPERSLEKRGRCQRSPPSRNHSWTPGS